MPGRCLLRHSFSMDSGSPANRWEASLGFRGRGLFLLGLYRDNGKENGNCYIIIRYILGL